MTRLLSGWWHILRGMFENASRPAVVISCLAAVWAVLLSLAGLGLSEVHGIGAEESVSRVDALTRYFRAHEQDFATLGRMLDADERHLAKYDAALRKIGASGLRFLPDSSDTAVVALYPDTDVSVRHSFVHRGSGDPADHSRAFRPGLHVIVRDFPLDDRWLIRREVDVPVIVAPH